MVRPRFSIFDFLIYLFLILLSLSFLYPIANQFALSISDAGELGWQGVTVITGRLSAPTPTAPCSRATSSCVITSTP